MHAVKISSSRASNLTCSDHQTRIKPGENIIDSATFERVKVDIEDWQKLGWVSVVHVDPDAKAPEAPVEAKPEGGKGEGDPAHAKPPKAKKAKPAPEAPVEAKPEGE